MGNCSSSSTSAALGLIPSNDSSITSPEIKDEDGRSSIPFSPYLGGNQSSNSSERSPVLTPPLRARLVGAEVFHPRPQSEEPKSSGPYHYGYGMSLDNTKSPALGLDIDSPMASSHINIGQKNTDTELDVASALVFSNAAATTSASSISIEASVASSMVELTTSVSSSPAGIDEVDAVSKALKESSPIDSIIIESRISVDPGKAVSFADEKPDNPDSRLVSTTKKQNETLRRTKRSKVCSSANHHTVRTRIVVMCLKFIVCVITLLKAMESAKILFTPRETGFDTHSFGDLPPMIDEYGSLPLRPTSSSDGIGKQDKLLSLAKKLLAKGRDVVDRGKANAVHHYSAGIENYKCELSYALYHPLPSGCDADTHLGKTRTFGALSFLMKEEIRSEDVLM